MDKAVRKEEIRKGIQWDGDSIMFEFEKDDSVQELVDMIAESAKQQNLSFEEMVNKIILDYIFDQLRQDMLKWIRMMELNENNRMREFKLPKPSEGDKHNRDSRNEDERKVPNGCMHREGSSEMDQNLFLENGDEAGLFEVCQYFISHYPEDIYTTGSDHPVTIMRDMAKEVITSHEMTKR